MSRSTAPLFWTVKVVDFEVPFSRSPVYQLNGVMLMGDSLYAVEAVAPARKTKRAKRTIRFMDVPSVNKPDLHEIRN